MARPIQLRQRVSLDSTRKFLQISQNQNGQVRTALIPLKEPADSSRDLHRITDYAHEWPSTEIDVTTPEFLPNKPSE
jgi:hypothetical protein